MFAQIGCGRAAERNRQKRFDVFVNAPLLQVPLSYLIGSSEVR